MHPRLSTLWTDFSSDVGHGVAWWSEPMRTLGEIEQTGGSKEAHANIMRESMIAMAAPF